MLRGILGSFRMYLFKERHSKRGTLAGTMISTCSFNFVLDTSFVFLSFCYTQGQTIVLLFVSKAPNPMRTILFHSVSKLVHKTVGKRLEA